MTLGVSGQNQKRIKTCQEAVKLWFDGWYDGSISGEVHPNSLLPRVVTEEELEKRIFEREVAAANAATPPPQLTEQANLTQPVTPLPATATSAGRPCSSTLHHRARYYVVLRGALPGIYFSR